MTVISYIAIDWYVPQASIIYKWPLSLCIFFTHFLYTFIGLEL